MTVATERQDELIEALGGNLAALAAVARRFRTLEDAACRYNEPDEADAYADQASAVENALGYCEHKARWLQEVDR